MNHNAIKAAHFGKAAFKWAMYGAIVGVFIGSLAGWATARTEKYDSEYDPGCSGYVCHFRPMTESERTSESVERFFGGAALGGVCGASIGCLPLTLSAWFLLLVMLGQVSDAARGSKPRRLRHNVRVKFTDE